MSLSPMPLPGGAAFKSEAISPAVREELMKFLAPVTLDRSSDRFDIGVEFQKAQMREWLIQRFPGVWS